MKLSRQERSEIAARRLVKVLRDHGVANARTLEQKISDAGPYGQRIDPHILTEVRNGLVKDGRLQLVTQANTPWYFLPETPATAVQNRLDAQAQVYGALHQGSLPMRTGQALEIATYRALLDGPLTEFYGRFKDLEDHDDSTMYQKEEPPQHVGRHSLSGSLRLDFMVRHPDAGNLGLECKNTRPWLYPQDEEIKETIAKAVAIDAVPVVIARRIPYVSFLVLSHFGVILHETFNQLIPETAKDIADRARDKKLLGYHDIKLGNQPTPRLSKFITTTLPTIAADARAKFDVHKETLKAYSTGQLSYWQLAGETGHHL